MRRVCSLRRVSLCSGRTLTAERAANLIRDLDHFKREAHFTLETRVPFQTAFKCVEQAEVDRAPLIRFGLQRGWVRFDSRDTVLGFGTEANCPSLALTQPGEAASAHWTSQRSGASDGVAWAIPIGQRELMEVTKLATAPDGSTQVEFGCKWIRNETGVELRKSVAAANAFFDTAQKRSGVLPSNN